MAYYRVREHTIALFNQLVRGLCASIAIIGAMCMLISLDLLEKRYSVERSACFFDKYIVYLPLYL